jgi:hypothetical protein
MSVLYQYQRILLLMNPAWPEAQPWDNLVFSIVAVIIVLLNRKAMLTREGAVTEVLVPGEEGSPDVTHGSWRLTDPSGSLTKGEAGEPGSEAHVD